MGSGNSHVDVSAVSLQWYQASLQHPCLLPDVGVDESLLRFSGINSNTELQAYSSELADKVPDYIEKFVSNFGTFSPIPNAVGLGALMISMILEIAMKSTTTQTNENSYSMLQRVFGEEKASSVRDTMTDCVDRHRTYMNNEQRLAEELRILERTLSGHLATLKNSLLYDGQMSSRGFKIWVNGAYFQVQMLIHEARLSKKPKKAKAEDVKSISALIDRHLQDLDRLLDIYKPYKTRMTKATSLTDWCYVGLTSVVCKQSACLIINIDNKQVQCEVKSESLDDPCESSDVMEAYINRMFTDYNPVLKSHFLDVKTNLVSVISQHDAFTPPYID